MVHPDVKLVNGKLDFSDVAELPESVTVTFAVDLTRAIADPIERKEFNFDFDDTVIFGYILDEDIDNLPPSRCNGYFIQYTHRVQKKTGSLTVNHVDKHSTNLTNPVSLTGMEDEHYDIQRIRISICRWQSSRSIHRFFTNGYLCLLEKYNDTPKSEDPNAHNQENQNQKKLDKNDKDLPQTGINKNHYFGYLTFLCGASMLTLSHLNRKNDE